MADKTIAVQVQFNGINEATNSIAALTKELNKLKEEQKKADPTSQEFQQLEQQIAAVSGSLRDLTTQQKAANQAFQDAKLAVGSYAALKAETKALEAQFKSMAVGVNATQEEYDAVLAKIKENNLEITRLNREMRNSASIAQRFKEGAVAAFKEVATAIAAGTAALVGFGALKGLGDLGLELERGFAQVNTVAQLTEEQLASLKDQVLETAKDSTVNLEEVPGALFKILSATGDVAESQKILESSLRAAKVGFTDLSSAADAGTNIYGAVKEQVKDVNEVYDVLFRTQKEGVLTFGDLAKAIPLVTPAANTLGIGFKETAAALATLTKAGVSADIATTQLKAGFSELGNAQKQAGLKEIGVSIFDSEGKIRSFNEIVQQLGKSLDGLTDEQRSAKLAKVGFGQEAVGSILTLTKNIETFGEVTQSIVDGSLGEFDRQLAASSNTADDLKAATNNLKVTLIQNLQPSFEAVGITVVNLIRGFAQLIGFFLENKGIVLLLASAYLALNAAQVQNFAILVKQRALRLALLAIDKSEAAFLAIKTAATTAYGVAQSILTGRLTLAAAAQQLLNLAMAANPVGLVVAGMTALAGILLIVLNRTKELTEAEKRRAEVSKQIQESIAATNEAIGKETAQLEILVKGINDETKSKEEKKKITDQLISQYGKYLSELDKEAIKAGNVEVAYRKIKAAIIDTIIARQKQETIEQVFSEQLKNQLDSAQRIGEAYGLNSQQVLKLVKDFRELPLAVQEAVNAGQGLDVLGTKAAEGFTEAQKESVKFFVDVENNALRAARSIEGVTEAVKAGADPKKLGVDVAVQQILAAEDAMNEGLKEIDQRFGTLGGTMDSEMGAGGAAIDETTASVAELEKQLSALQATQKETSRNTKEWQDQQKEIDRVKAAIERITGASKDSIKASKDAAKETANAAKEEKESAEKRYSNLLELRKQLSDALLENQDDETAKLLKAEEERYAKQQQLALDNAAKITLDTKASKDEIEEATKLQDAILEQLQLEHWQKLNDITAQGIRQEQEAQEKADAQRVANQVRLNDLSLEAVETELSNEEKNFQRRRKLIKLQGEFQIKALEMETTAQLKAAQSDEERTKIMEVEAQKRIAIVKGVQQKLEDEKGTLEDQFARVLGISPEELSKFQDVFKQGLSLLNEAIDQFFAARLAAIDVLIENQQKKIDLAAEAAEKQVDRVQRLEDRLATATGERRERLIALIDQERQREKALFAEKVKQEAASAAIEQKKIEIENKQAKIRKAQAIAQAIANTAVGITRTIAEVPKVDFGVSTAILIGLYAGLGAAQVALISAQKFAKGGKVSGPSHDQGGVPMAVPSQNRYVELEGNEFVINKRATQRNADVLDMINREGHRTSFTIEPRQFEAGGQVSVRPNFGSVNAAIANNQGAAGISESKVDRMIDLLAIVASKDPEVNVVEFSRRLNNVRAIENQARAF